MNKATPRVAAKFFIFASIFLIVAALYLAKEVLIPLALAVLLSFLLVPLVSRLEAAGLRRVFSVGICALVATMVICAVVWVVSVQITELAGKAELYEQNIRSKIRILKDQSEGIFSKFRSISQHLRSELEVSHEVAGSSRAREQAQVPAEPLGSSQRVPIWTKSSGANSSPILLIKDTLSPLLEPLATLGIVLVLTIFILIHREDLRDRIIGLVGEGRISITTEAMDEAGAKVSRYLLMQLIVNICYGIPVALALWLIGVPNALLWGIMAMVCRFVPYIGPWISAGVPILLSFAISDGWAQPAYTISTFIILELVSNNIMEPLLYGKGTGLSPVAILVAAMFWTWVWGIVGLILSTPITVCIAVMGKYIPNYRFLSLLLSDAPPLAPHYRVYQRLLAQDVDEAGQIVAESLKKSSLLHVFDKVLLPALALCEYDRQRGEIEEGRSVDVLNNLGYLIDDCVNLNAGQVDNLGIESLPSASMSNLRVLCIPLRNTADELSAKMLSALLELIGANVELGSAKNLASENLEILGVSSGSSSGFPLVVISAMPPDCLRHIRYLLKRLHAGRKLETKAIFLAVWDKNLNSATYSSKLGSADLRGIENTLSTVLSSVIELAPELAFSETNTRPLSSTSREP